jgi:hypothetical protein
MQIDREKMLREQAFERGLIFPGLMPPTGRRAHHLELTQPMLAAELPQDLMALISLARDCADCYENGEHLAIINLYAREADLIRFLTTDNQLVTLQWGPLYAFGDKSGLIRMRDWLARYNCVPDLRKNED